MNSSEKRIYLGKKGKIYGPFPPEKLKEMHRSGEIQNFAFIWDAPSGQWNPLEALPPNPVDLENPASGVTQAGVENRGSPSTSPQKASKRGVPSSISWTEIEVFCHDFMNIVVGKLESVTETGCDLVSSPVPLSQDTGDHPRLGVQSRVILNLVNGGKSMNVKATLSQVFREEENKNQKWTYRLEWDGIPSFS